MLENLILLILLTNFPVVVFFKKITKVININDKADNVRKFHKNTVPLFGGILIIYNLIIFLLLDNLLDLNLFQEFKTRREFFTFYTGIIAFFLLGIFDDKYNLTANKKLFLNFFIVLFLILLDDKLVVRELNFSFFENPIYLNNFSHLFTILCILLLINALNMFDGINLQTGTYCLIVFLVFLIKNIFVPLSLILICVLIIFLFYNSLNKIFLGDSGTQLIAFIISYILIKSHNLSQNFTPEEIFIILSFPGLDMFRLFLFRIVKGKNPFKPDTNHIHHLMIKKLSKLKTFLIIQSCIIFNIVFFYFINNKLNALFLSIISYLSLYLIFFKKGKKIE